MTLFEVAAVLTLDKAMFDKGISEAEGQAQGFGSKLKSGISGGVKAAAGALTASTGAVVSFGKSAVEAGMTFDTSMSQVAAISGATGIEFEQLREKAKEMGASTVFSASEAADAMNYMAMAGWKTEDMLGGIEGIMNLAAASGEDLASTSDIVTNALTAFGMKVEESGKFADILAVASSNANTDVAMMGETFKYVAPIAGTLGFNAEDTAVAIGLMANSGIQASQAGTSLRGALTRLVKPTKDMQEAMVGLGLATVETEHTFDQAKIDKLQSKVADKTAAAEKAQISYNNAVSKYGANSAQAQKAAISLETAQRKLAEATAELTKEQAGYDEETGIQNNLLTNSEGEMKSLNEIVVQLRSTFADLTEAEKAEAAATLFGQEAASGMLAIINASEEDFDKLTEAVNNADGAAQQMAETMTDNLAGDITKFQSAMEGAQIMLSDQLTPSLREFVQFGTEGIGQITAAFSEGGMEGGFSAIGEVLSDGIAMISDYIPEFVKAGRLLLENLVYGIIENAPVFVQGFSDILNDVIGALPEFFSNAGELISTAIQDIVPIITENLPLIIDGIAEALTAIADGISNSTVIADTVPKLINGLVSIIQNNLPKLLTAGLDIIKAIGEGIVKNIPMLVSGVKDIVEAIAGFVSDNLPDIIEAGLGILVALADGILQAIPTLIEMLPTVIDTIITVILDSIPLIINAGIQLLTSLVAALPDIIAAVVEAIPKIISGIVDALITSIPIIIQAGVDLLIALVQNLPTIITEIVKAIPQIISGIVEGLFGNIDKIIMAGVQLFVALIENLPTIIVEIVKAVPQIIGGIVDAFGSMIGSIVEIGGNLLKGIWEGITGAADWLWEQITGFFGGIVDGIKDFLGIHSPSTVFADMGKNMALGIGEGFDDEFDGIRKDMNDQMDFTATADVQVNKNRSFNDTYTEYGSNAGNYGGSAAPVEKQPLIVVVQLENGLELARALIENINDAKRIDGYAY